MSQDVQEMDDVIDFLAGRGLLGAAGQANDGASLYGITMEGLQVIYGLNLVLASGFMAQEVKGTPQEADARQVAQCAAALVRALDELSTSHT